MKTTVRSFWTAPLEWEQGAPEIRIVHQKVVTFSSPVRNIRIGLREGEGYFKCGSDSHRDAVTALQIYAEQNGRFCLVREERSLTPGPEPFWLELKGETKAVCITARRSRTDGYWPCYNIVMDGILVTAEGEKAGTRPTRVLHTVSAKEECAEDGIDFGQTSVAASYRTPYYAIALRKKSAGLFSLALDGWGTGRLQEELLYRASVMLSPDEDGAVQGPLQRFVDGAGDCSFPAYPLKGETAVSGSGLGYRVENDTLRYELRFSFTGDCIRLRVAGEVLREAELWNFALLRIGFTADRTPMTLLGPVQREGETGRVSLPATVHLPGYASLQVRGKGLYLRGDSVRPLHLNTLDIHPAGDVGENGMYRLLPGPFGGEMEIKVGWPLCRPLKEDAPEAVKRANRMFQLTALPFRADTDTFANNGNSMGAPICMDVWSEICDAIGTGPCGVDAADMLRRTLESWLSGAPAYASGFSNDGSHRYEDEYLMTGASALAGLGRYLVRFADETWFARFRRQIEAALDLAQARDEDGDGMIESRYRLGITGQHQWSTAWYDVISYGHKDALSNALMYKALIQLEQGFSRFGASERAAQVSRWAKALKASYRKTFLTEKGWLAGWQSPDGVLHDHGFLAVNGLAASLGLIEGETARRAIRGLYDALLDAGFDGFDMGLPGNVYDIPNADMAAPQFALPFGGYQNAGVTLSQSCHFLRGLYAVGMTAEADSILTQMAQGLTARLNTGGSMSGVDWKTWDGISSGYEGLLCDQMGVIAVMLERWGADPGVIA